MHTKQNSCAREVDREFFARELASFLPERIFAAHTHLWRADIVLWSLENGAANVGYTEYENLMQDIHPGRSTKALFIPGFNPNIKEHIQDANEWNAQHCAADPDCRSLFFVKPEDDPEWVRQEVRRLRLHGLKCYHTFASVKPTWQAEIPDYLPEPLVKIADDEGWVITLHMVKSRAVADPGNLHWIRHYCKTYPNMKLILAHSARGFQPAHNLEGLPQLKGLDNLFFDTSANCEPIAHQAIIRIIGHKKLMYGTDLPVSHMRGRSLSAADSFVWLYGDSPVWGEKHLAIEPILIGLEHLRSLKWACWSEHLSDSAIEDIFWNNAAELFGIG